MERFRPRLAANPSQYVAREVLVFDQVRQGRADVLDLDADGAARVFGTREGNLFEQPFHAGVEAAGADVLEGAIDPLRVARDLANGFLGELKIDALGPQKSRVLLQQRVLRLRQDPNEVFLGQGIELDANREA